MKKLLIPLLLIAFIGCNRQKYFFVSYRIDGNEVQETGCFKSTGELESMVEYKQSIIEDYKCMGRIVYPPEITITAVIEMRKKDMEKLGEGTPRTAFKTDCIDATIIKDSVITETGMEGSHPLLKELKIKPATIMNGSAKTDATTLYIEAPPSGVMGKDIPMILVDSGWVKFDLQSPAYILSVDSNGVIISKDSINKIKPIKSKSK